MSAEQCLPDDNSYERAVSHCDALRKVIPKFREKRAFIRITKPVTRVLQDVMPISAGPIGANRDRAVAALVNKGCNTHFAIRHLCDAGHGDDAMALGRVLLENAALLRWLLIDPVYRLDLYAVSDALFVRRWGQLIEAYRQDRPELVARARSEIDARTLAVAELFGDTIHRWAQMLHPGGKPEKVNFEQMMRENAEHGGSDSMFQYEFVYFLHSAFVHSTANSMRSFNRLRTEQHFDFGLGPVGRWRSTALHVANIFLLQILDAAAQYLHFADIESELATLFDQMKASKALMLEP